MSKKQRKLLLVDSENIQQFTKDYELLKTIRNTDIYYFYTEHNATRTISLTGLHIIQENNSRFYPFKVVGHLSKNALDFQLACFAMEQIMNKREVIQILSNDHGFDSVIAYMKERWRSRIKRMSYHNPNNPDVQIGKGVTEAFLSDKACLGSEHTEKKH